MEIQVATTPWHQAEADWLIVAVPQTGEFTGGLKSLDESIGGKLTRWRERGDLTGKLAETLADPDVQELTAKRLLAVGLGEQDKLDLAGFHKALMTAVRQVSTRNDLSVAVGVPENAGPLKADQCARSIATAAVVGSQGQDLYRAEAGRFPFEGITLLTTADSQTDVKRAAERGAIIGDAINLTRELVNRPAGEIYPESFAERARQVAGEHGIDCEVLDERQLQDERMGSLLGVAQGSDRPPRVVRLDYRGAGDDLPTLAVVGKGVTFDSGGLSLKPNDSMKTMKCDMAGAATVLGAVTAVARLKLPVNVAGYMGLVENMVSGRSYKLGDVLKARNGTTIEVLNTDAEGRLVLADVLSYAVDRGAAKLIDLATLTGSCMVALGTDITGVFTNDEQWQNDVLAAARRAGEDAWPLPMRDEFAELLKSDVADCKNVGPRWGGAIIAAKFLEKFVGQTPWVHLDIAGTAFADENKPHQEGGGTGAMVRTLVEAAAAWTG